MVRGPGRPNVRELVKAGLPGTPTAVLRKTGLGRTTIWRHITALHEQGECFISGWQRCEYGGPATPIYSPGPGKDKPCTLKPLTEAQKSRRYRRKARKNGTWEDRLKQQRARHHATKPARRDPIIEALFGRVKAPAT